MVAHIGKHQPAGYPDGPQGRCVEHGLVDAQARSSPQDPARPQSRSGKVGAVHLVAHALAHRVVERDRAFGVRAHRRGRPALHEVLDLGGAVVEEIRGREIRREVIFRGHGCFLLPAYRPSIDAIRLRWISEVPE